MLVTCEVDANAAAADDAAVVEDAADAAACEDAADAAAAQAIDQGVSSNLQLRHLILNQIENTACDAIVAAVVAGTNCGCKQQAASSDQQQQQQQQEEEGREEGGGRQEGGGLRRFEEEEEEGQHVCMRWRSCGTKRVRPPPLAFES